MARSDCNYLSKTVIKRLGFTEKMIVDKLGPHERTRENPKYRSAAPMLLWDAERVGRVMDEMADALISEYDIALDGTPECREVARAEAWSRFVESRRRVRCAAARRSVETKRAQTMALVDKQIARIRVRKVRATYDQMLDRGVRNWQDLQCARGRFECDGWNADIATKERWAVNYVRHCLTDYDDELFEQSGRVGVSEAYLRYRKGVFVAISEAYPYLAGECSRQAAYYDAE